MPERDKDPHNGMENRAGFPRMGPTLFDHTRCSPLKHPVLGFTFSGRYLYIFNNCKQGALQLQHAKRSSHVTKEWAHN